MRSLTVAMVVWRCFSERNICQVIYTKVMNRHDAPPPSPISFSSLSIGQREREREGDAGAAARRKISGGRYIFLLVSFFFLHWRVGGWIFVFGFVNVMMAL